jgi:hypothetical protein
VQVCGLARVDRGGQRRALPAVGGAERERGAQLLER